MEKGDYFRLNPTLMKYLKRKLTPLFFLCLSGSMHAQLKLPAAPSSFKNDMQQIVAEFPLQFRGLRGEVLAKNPQTIEYASLLKPQGAVECWVTQYSSSNRPVYTWQATMLSTEEFEEAARKYKALFSQLKGMNVRYVADQYTLQGKMMPPAEERNFMTSVLTVAEAPAPWRKLRVEVTMQFEFPEWKVGVSVFEREKEDDQRGDTEE